MGVHVDHAGNAGQGPQVDHAGACRNLPRAGTYGGDASVRDNHNRIRSRGAGSIDQLPEAHRYRLGGCYC